MFLCITLLTKKCRFALVFATQLAEKFIFLKISGNFIEIGQNFDVFLIDNTEKWLYNYYKADEYYPFPNLYSQFRKDRFYEQSF